MPPVEITKVKSSFDTSSIVSKSYHKDFLKGRAPKATFKGFPLYISDEIHGVYGSYKNEFILVQGNLAKFGTAFVIDSYNIECIKDEADFLLKTHYVEGVVTHKGKKRVVLINADMRDVEINELLNETLDSPTLSITCLARFFSKTQENSDVQKAIDDVYYWFNEGLFEVVDYTKDEVIDLSESDTQKIEIGEVPAPPEAGYTLIPNVSSYRAYWHRPSSVLIRDIETDKYYLFGQDEGQYFGVELPEPKRSVKSAFKSLMPKNIQRVKDVQRQGEWFIVPVKNRSVPKIEDCICSSFNGVMLPVDDETSSFHVVYGEARVGKDGTIYANNGSLEHHGEQHAPKYYKGWVKFVKNTAVRSVSEEGVD